MNLEEAIERLEQLVSEVRQASLNDDKTRLGSALALSQEGRLINEGKSEFDVIVFGDLNDFKQLNDEHGHDAGDIAINSVGETLHKIVVEELQGKAFRQSGDDFVILLRQDLVKKFVSTMGTFRSILFSYNEQQLKTSMSFGFAVSDRRTTFSELKERAEVACQHGKAKEDGSCVEWSEDIQFNPLVRRSARCERCRARISCNVPRRTAPAFLAVCPCCAESLQKRIEPKL
jgi:diguanylate cyclase (GGDEF)-like protein